MIKTIDTDIILMHGSPASGKTSLNEKYKKLGYKILSRDKRGGSMKDLLFYLMSHSKKYDKVVIDATFPTIESREAYIEYAKSVNKTIGCHIVNTSKDDALINAILRVHKITGEFYFYHDEIPSKWKNNPQIYVYPAIFSFFKTKKTPSKTEGFDKLIKTKFERVWDDVDIYKNKAVFVDLDGTIRETKNDDKFPVELNNQYILPNSEEILKEYKSKGYKIIGVSNQSGVNKGQFIDNVDDIIMETNNMIDNVIEDYRYCPHTMPTQICTCRKPQSGIGLYFREKYKLDLSQCVMVGDRTTDKTFAKRLGIEYHDHSTFFKRN